MICKLHYITTKGFKVYPTHDITKRFAVTITDENKTLYKRGKAKGEYKHTTKTINEAIKLMINHIYLKLTK